MKWIIDLLNENQGVISIIGLFVVIPFTIISDGVMKRTKQKEQNNELKNILLKEFWMNINFVSQIQESYLNNVHDNENLHIPHYSPRTEILDKYFQYDLLTGLNINEKESFIEIYSQLINLKNKYLDWRTRLINNPDIIKDKDIYYIISSTMLSYVEPLMKNLLDVWLVIVKSIGSKSNVEQIQNLNVIIRDLIKQGKWIRTCYKSSFFDRPEYLNTPKFDAILCWDHDSLQTQKEVIEVKNIIALHESWKK